VAFLLDGVPHHVAGTWHGSKKITQRDTAERALGFFVGSWGEQLLSEEDSPPLELPVRDPSQSDTQMLEEFCQICAECDEKALVWSHSCDQGGCCAQVEISILGVPHKFGGSAKRTPAEAYLDVARRVLWYLQCPGYEEDFEPDPEAPAVVGKEIPAPPAHWATDASKVSAVRLADQKTALMRVQNRLQQTYARQLQPGQRVWEWSYENDEHDTEWPCLCRATVHLPVVGQCFTGNWVRGANEAQIDACLRLTNFLDEAVTER